MTAELDYQDPTWQNPIRYRINHRICLLCNNKLIETFYNNMYLPYRSYRCDVCKVTVTDYFCSARYEIHNSSDKPIVIDYTRYTEESEDPFKKTEKKIVQDGYTRLQKLFSKNWYETIISNIFFGGK